MTDDPNRTASMAQLVEICGVVGLDFDLGTALASGVSTGEAAFLALRRAPSREERDLIRSGAMPRPRLNLAERHLDA
ncbi:hypothetical protein AB6806_10910 [Bosea sp. RCC_152_1]|uniref:hypothetical protein n=1 Tax=Bosea sp. RCC_152_1 TaxID=3239228 RepID=UPI0035247C95